jgi:hypothetical protein
VAPILLSLATTEGWTQPFLTIAVVLVLELILNNIVEPLFYGSSMGVSEIAFLVFAAVWAFLWGAVGLVLSAPLTVILLVLGQRVPQLSALNVLLGEETPLDPHVRLFQRLIAKDQDEATRVFAAKVEEVGAVKACDEVLLPALNLLVNSERSGEIDRLDLSKANERAMEMLEDVIEGEQRLEWSPNTEDESRPRLILIPMDPESDQVVVRAARMFVDSRDWKVEVPASEMLLAELVDWVDVEPSSVVCVLGLHSAGEAHARYICKRLLSNREQMRLLVGRLGRLEADQERKDAFRNLGAQEETTTLEQTLATIASWRPIARQESTSAAKAPLAAVV